MEFGCDVNSPDSDGWYVPILDKVIFALYKNVVQVNLLKDHPFCKEKVAFKKGWPLLRGDNLVVFDYHSTW